jgi:hypothetical protein
MVFLKALAFLLVVMGALTVFGARFIVKKYNLDKTEKCNFESEMSDGEIEKYKYDKALVKIKMIGMLFAVPGIIILMIIFK